MTSVASYEEKERLPLHLKGKERERERERESERERERSRSISHGSKKKEGMSANKMGPLPTMSKNRVISQFPDTFVLIFTHIRCLTFLNLT